LPGLIRIDKPTRNSGFFVINTEADINILSDNIYECSRIWYRYIRNNNVTNIC